MIPDILLYLLKVNLALILFFLGYRFLLRRYTFYTINRYYLFIGLAYSAFYPLLDFNKLFAEDSEVRQLSNLDIKGSITYVIMRSESSLDPLCTTLISIFWAGVCFFLIRLFTQLLSLRRIHLSSETAQSAGYKFRRVRDTVSPFSFWKNIYLNPECHPHNEILPILEHEQVHVDQLHTLDVLFSELCAAFYWFNPGVWLLKNAIKVNLEFITDQEVIRSGIDKKAYQYALLKINTLESNNLPVNNFKIVSLKNRIKMINKTPSNKLNLGSYLLVFPAILFFLAVVSVSQAALNPETAKAVMAVLPDVPVVQNKFTTQDTVPVIKDKKEANGVLKVIKVNDSTQLIRLKNKDGNLLISDSVVINPDKPLYILDGREIVTIQGLDPERIQSITVVKGANGIRAYGAKGKNGVVEITSKESLYLNPADTNKISSLNRQARAVTVARVPGTAISSDPVSVTGYRTSVADKNGSPARVTGRALGTSREGLTITGYPIQKTEKVSLNNLKGALIFLNGKEIDKQEMESIPVGKIGNIEVLKGKMASDIYGEKGKNGVILISTKQ